MGRCRKDDGGRTRHVAGIIQDITERKSHEAEIERLSRLYAALSQINQAIVRAKSMADLAGEIARVAVTFGGFKLAWVGQHEPTSHEVVPLGWAGEPQEIVRGFRHCLDDTEEHRCFCAPVIREDRPRVLNNFAATTSEMYDWRAAMEQSGIRAAAVFPIRVRGVVWGVFGVYDGVPDTFQGREIALLEEAAMDIGYAIEHIENESHRRQAEKFQLLSTAILGLLNEPLTLREASQAILGLIKKETGLDAVGIRMKSGDDYPYFSTQGFDDAFLIAENSVILRGTDNSVCRNADGSVCLQCTCGMVLSEKCGPPGDHVTEAGSIWTNDAPALARILHGQDQRLTPRDRCLHEGFLSVALIPIRADGQMIGLLHLNDRRKDRFSPEIIRFFEELTASFGIAVKRKRAEDTLRTSETQLRLFIEHAPVALAMFDRDMRYLAVSHRWLADYGLEGREVRGRSHYEIFPEIGEELKRIHRRGLAGETARADNARFERADGSVQHLRWEMHPWRDGGGEIGGIVIFTEDITARTRTEAALRESEERFRLLIEGAPEAVFVQCAGTFQYVNQAMVKLVGATRADELLGHPFLERIAPEFHDAIEARIQAQRQTKTAAPPMEQIYLCMDGTPVPVETTAVAVRFQGQDGNMVFVHDITARRKAETDRNSLEAQLRQAQKMESVGRLAGGVAHDFNNLLMGIMGYADLAREKVAADHPVRSCLDEITASAQRSAGITRQLLAFARKQTISPVALDLNDHVARMLKLLRRLIREDIQITWSPGTTKAQVKMDPSQIDQILANLAVNARDAIVGVGSLTIGTRQTGIDAAYCAKHAGAVPGDYVVLDVSDSGCGMDRSTRERIFEPFFTTKAPGKGSGLGLATVYGIVQQNRGFIEVVSEPGQGTTFHIYIPRLDEEVAGGDGATPTAEAPGGSETILLVEDEKSVRITTGLFLQGLGYTVLTASNPEDALVQVKAYPGAIHLLITDVVMPGMSGLDLAKKLAAAFPEMACLYVSGYTADVIAHQGILDEGVHFLAKPFARSDLAQKIRDLLRGQRKTTAGRDATEASGSGKAHSE